MIHETLEVVSGSVTSEATGTILLRDRRSGKEVSGKDIGVGISQVVPVLVGAMDSRNEIIVIEQPEIHLHPWLQAELGDVFIDSAMTRGNRFVLETHSEHLILRIMRRIRENTHNKVPDDRQPLTTRDVCVLYVTPGSDGSQIRELRINDQGDFVDPWPEGFFEDRLKELF
jgi:predicted ATPase